VTENEFKAIVNFQKYDSYIGGNVIENAMLTLFFLVWNRQERIVRRLFGRSKR